MTMNATLNAQQHLKRQFFPILSRFQWWLRLFSLIDTLRELCYYRETTEMVHNIWIQPFHLHFSPTKRSHINCEVLTWSLGGIMALMNPCSSIFALISEPNKHLFISCKGLENTKSTSLRSPIHWVFSCECYAWIYVKFHWLTLMRPPIRVEQAKAKSIRGPSM